MRDIEEKARIIAFCIFNHGNKDYWNKEMIYHFWDAMFEESTWSEYLFDKASDEILKILNRWEEEDTELTTDVVLDLWEEHWNNLSEMVKDLGDEYLLHIDYQEYDKLARYSVMRYSPESRKCITDFSGSYCEVADYLESRCLDKRIGRDKPDVNEVTRVMYACYK